MSSHAELALDRFLTTYPPKSAQLIVTIYGDIVEPRGGMLWMGDLISLCAGFDVNESLVRTAVSRLVAKGQLSGQREGRRSFYALTPEARNEYQLAADLFFGQSDTECDWIITHCPDPDEQAELKRHGFAVLGGSVLAGADRPGRPYLGTVFRSSVLQPHCSDLMTLVHKAFELDRLFKSYSGFVKQFSEMKDAAEGMTNSQMALLFRLALVHAYRSIRLRDPRLPKSVLPADWPGFDARRLFAELYGSLSCQADVYIGRQFNGLNGPMAERPENVEKRLASLASEP